MKVCSCCKENKDVDKFAKKGAGLQPICKVCRSVWFKQHYESNKRYYLDRNKTARKSNLAWLKEYKSKLFCTKCGESDPACLDFHHIDPTLKDSVVSVAAKKSRGSLMAELDKCEVLCSNCHRKHHYYSY